MNKITIFLLAIVLYIVSAAVSYSYFSNGSSSGTPVTLNPSPTPDPDVSPTETGEPATEECPLNGKLYPKSQREIWEKRRPLGIMVENHEEARPQSGLSSSDVMYEVVAEGGITRFLVVFYCQDAKPVGPVRSSRLYFIRLLQEYGDFPLYAHVGGAAKEGPADALGEIQKLDWYGYNDMDTLYGMGFPYFRRDPERLPGVAWEHTTYTDTKLLWEFAVEKRDLSNVDKEGASWDADFTKYTFKDDATAAKRGDVKKISFGFWNQFASDYSVEWAYDSKTNSYKRENGGEPHEDKNIGEQLEAKNIVVIYADESVANDGYEHGQHLLYDLIGTGDGYIFQDGEATKIEWAKKTSASRMTFATAAGEDVMFVRGKIFFEILPTGNKVTY